METLWFILLAWMLATYVVLDGFDLGAGVLHLVVARSDEERRRVLETVGPVWDGNEVWLIAAGGSMFFAFPPLLATSFAGFYLPLMIALWLLVFRALGIELRHQVDDRLWTAAWDAAFCGASVLLAFGFGAALANVVRGVPLGDDGTFFEPLWTDFRVTGATGVLDWYTVLVGTAALLALAHHGSLWIAARTDGRLRGRAMLWARGLWPALAALLVLLTVATFRVQPNAIEGLTRRPWGGALPVVAGGGLVAARYLAARGRPWPAFLASAAMLYGLVGSAALAVYPFVLPSSGTGPGLTAEETAASTHALRTGLWWWIPGMAIVCGYFVYTYRAMLRTGSPGTGATRSRGARAG